MANEKPVTNQYQLRAGISALKCFRLCNMWSGQFIILKVYLSERGKLLCCRERLSLLAWHQQCKTMWCMIKKLLHNSHIVCLASLWGTIASGEPGFYWRASCSSKLSSIKQIRRLCIRLAVQQALGSSFKNTQNPILFPLIIPGINYLIDSIRLVLSKGCCLKCKL